VPLSNVSVSFQQLNVAQLSNEALAEYRAMLRRLIAIAEAEPHAVLDSSKG